MSWKIDVVVDAHESGERCGRCGELAPAGAAVCPACGALLDAYRTPAESPDPTADTLPEALKDDRPEQVGDQPDVSIDEMDSSTPEAIEIELAEDAPDASYEATPGLHSGSDKPEILEDRPIVTPRSERAVRTPTAPSLRPSQGERSAPLPVARAMPAVRDATPSRPRKPGYVTRGTVEPVILLGGVLLVLAVCLVTTASLISVRGVAVTGFVLGAFGILGIAVAVLVALVRREREIG